MIINQVKVDIAIIGGGINGCGIARDAAGRGLSVYLCEQNDLASGTSSWSTKLIHGGLRYLEHFEFRLVREALIERERLWRLAPHIIWPNDMRRQAPKPFTFNKSFANKAELKMLKITQSAMDEFGRPA